jgi:hypothetical protein
LLILLQAILCLLLLAAPLPALLLLALAQKALVACLEALAVLLLA